MTLSLEEQMLERERLGAKQAALEVSRGLERLADLAVKAAHEAQALVATDPVSAAVATGLSQGLVQAVHAVALVVRNL